jgi:UDP-N-acetylglucosamine 2-epimerase (non-hydrolysing)
MKRLRVLLTFGTRPEAIKIAPVVHACLRQSERIETIVCVARRQRQLLDQAVRYFDIPVALDINLTDPDLTAAEDASRCLSRLDRKLAYFRPDCVIAQGDSGTTMATATAAFYRRIPFVHVEAGLRAGDCQSAWPEEFNRRVASLAASLHCAPTARAAENLLREGVPADRVYVTGNTVIDALLWTVDRERDKNAPWRRKYAALGNRRMVLVAAGGRSNIRGGFAHASRAVLALAESFPEVEFVYIAPRNQDIGEPMERTMAERENIHLVEPAPYPEFVWLMDRSTLILTDSGGIQEEAPSLRKPVLLMREATDRPETLEAGAVELAGTNAQEIVERASILLRDSTAYAARQIDANPYGDGHAAQRIVQLILKQNWERERPHLSNPPILSISGSSSTAYRAA